LVPAVPCGPRCQASSAATTRVLSPKTMLDFDKTGWCKCCVF
jgi:hypothetical protein